MDAFGLITIQEAALRLGVRRETVTDLLDKHELKTKKIPFSPGRGIDSEMFAKLRLLLNVEEDVGSSLTVTQA